MMISANEGVVVSFFRKVYGSLLTLYPREHRDEFGEELQMVFNSSLDDAMKAGKFALVNIVLKELISLPSAILYEHLRERRKNRMTGKFAARFDFEPGSRTESFAALAPFLFFGALTTLLAWLKVFDVMPLWFSSLFAIAFWGIGLSLFVIGFKKGAPRWFMPYIGVPMPLVSALLFINLMEKLQGTWWYGLPWFLNDFLQVGLLWMGLLILVILLLVLTRFIPIFHSFYQRLKDDWTLLLFIIYGAMPLVLVFTFSEYKNEEPYLFLALLILAVGGWLYLQSYEALKRFLYLYGGTALSMLTVAVAKAVLVESSFLFVNDTAWQIEFMDTLITWLWLALIMLIPVLFGLFSHPDDPSVVI